MPATLTIPHVEQWKVLVAGIAALVTGCSGGGGATPAPTVQLEAAPTSVAVGGTSTLTWSSTNADTCQASDGWNGVRPPSGSETTGTINTATTFTLQCAGAGGSATASATVTIAAGDSSVAGHLLVPTISRSDSDVNDPFAPFAPNNTTAQAQVMPNPVVIGGFVSFVGFGLEDSRFFEDVDSDDFYRVDLLAGQVIELVIPTASALPGGDDADLFLVDLNGNDVASSEGEGQVETIVVQNAGTYFIDVFAFDGAPMYRLSVGQSTVVQNTPSLRLNDEFVPGELIVTLKDAGKNSDDVAATASTNAATLAERFGLSRKGGAPDREMLLKLPDDVTAVTSGTTPGSRANADTKTASTAATATGAAKSPAPRRRQAASALQQRKLDTIRYAKLLRRDPAVRSADLNRIMRTSLTPDDPDYAIQRWHYEQIQLPGAWDITIGSDAVLVAVVDTGVVTTHPELSSKLVQGYDFVSSPTNGDGNGRDAFPDDPGGCPTPGNVSFHGTHVAGTVGARTNDGSGVAGVGWRTRIMPIRALDRCGSGPISDIIEGIRYAAGLPNATGTSPPQPADVINLSLGTAGACDTALSNLFAQVRAQGVVVVAAAGNNNTDAPQSPASCDGVISVAATGPLRTKAPYSNFGSTVHLAAPGGDRFLDIDGNGVDDGVYSTHAVGGGGAPIRFTLDVLQGTSMAAPHVAGVIALMLSVNSGMTPAQFDQLLAQGALTDPVLGADPLGQGLINAAKAVGAANPNLPQPPPRISVTPSSLAFGDIGTLAQLVVVNAGGGTLDVTGFSPSEPWLSVAETAVDPNSGQGVYTISVDRTGLAVGSYSAFVLFTSNGGTGRVDVLMEVPDPNAVGEPSAGTQYVLLTDPETGVALPQQVRVLAEGRSPVPYQIDGVAAGQYIIVSGTDLNNDGFICDPAEACGAYPVESAPVPIIVDGAETGFDFVVSYRTGVPTSASSTSTKGVRKEIRRYRLIK